MDSTRTTLLFLMGTALMFSAALAAEEECNCKQAVGSYEECVYATGHNECDSHPCTPKWECVDAAQATDKCIHRIVHEKLVPNMNGGCEMQPVEGEAVLEPIEERTNVKVEPRT